MKSVSHVRLFATLWTVAFQAPLSMEFSRQEYWSGVSLPSPTYIYIPKQYFLLNSNSWNHIVSILVWVASLAQHYVFNNSYQCNSCSFLIFIEVDSFHLWIYYLCIYSVIYEHWVAGILLKWTILLSIPLCVFYIT